MRTQRISTIRVEYKGSLDTEWTQCNYNWNQASYYKGQFVNLAPWVLLDPFDPDSFVANMLLLDINGAVQDCYPFAFQF